MEVTDAVIDHFGSNGVWTLGTRDGLFVERRGGSFAFRDDKVVTWLKRVAAVSQRLPMNFVTTVIHNTHGKWDEDPSWMDECLRLAVALVRENVFEFCSATWKNPELGLQFSEFVANVVLAAQLQGDTERFRKLSEASDKRFRELNQHVPEDRPKVLTSELFFFLGSRIQEIDAQAQPVCEAVFGKLQAAHRLALDKSVDTNLTPDDTNLVPIFEHSL